MVDRGSAGAAGNAGRRPGAARAGSRRRPSGACGHRARRRVPGAAALRARRQAPWPERAPATGVGGRAAGRPALARRADAHHREEQRVRQVPRPGWRRHGTAAGASQPLRRPARGARCGAAADCRISLELHGLSRAADQRTAPAAALVRRKPRTAVAASQICGICVICGRAACVICGICGCCAIRGRVTSAICGCCVICGICIRVIIRVSGGRQLLQLITSRVESEPRQSRLFPQNVLR